MTQETWRRPTQQNRQTDRQTDRQPPKTPRYRRDGTKLDSRTRNQRSGGRDRKARVPVLTKATVLRLEASLLQSKSKQLETQKAGERGEEKR